MAYDREKMKNGVLTFSPLLLNLDTIVKLLSGEERRWQYVKQIGNVEGQTMHKEFQGGKW